MIKPLAALDAASRLASGALAQCAAAPDLPALREVAQRIPDVAGALHRAGCTIDVVAAVVRTLDDGLFERVWRTVATPALVAGSCLFVMGSEGRGEQVLRTDQDNGLVLGDGIADDASVEVACERFSQALRDFGYPDCPGGIMVSHAPWRQRVDDFTRTARRWVLMPAADGLMNLAIFLDARPVCGDAALLERVHSEVFALSIGSDALLGRFAAAIDAFPDHHEWWNRLLPHTDHARQSIDLKKSGLFPLVHGVRSLALAQHVRATGTVARLAALRDTGALSSTTSTDLADSLHFLMDLKLRTTLARAADDASPPNVVRVDRLAALDRGQLDAALDVVRQFKSLLRHRFRLDALS